MVKALVFDFSRTLLFPKDKMYKGGLNELNNKLSLQPGYKFLDHFELNQELLGFLYTIKDKFDLYILTTETIQESPEIKPQVATVFKKVYTAKELKLSKKEPQIYEYIAKQLILNPLEMLYVDDSQECIAAANQAGLHTLQYVDNLSVIKKIQELEAEVKK